MGLQKTNFRSKPPRGAVLGREFNGDTCECHRGGRSRSKNRPPKEIHMRYRLLGNSGLRVSEAALGAMTFGDDWGWGAAKDEARKVYDAFREAGGNFIDTANYLHQRDQRIVPRRVYAGPPPERGVGHEIHQRPSGHGPERGRQPAQEYGAGRRSAASSGCAPIISTFIGSTSGTRLRRSKRSCADWTTWFAQARCSTSASPTPRPGGSRRRTRLP